MERSFVSMVHAITFLKYLRGICRYLSNFFLNEVNASSNVKKTNGGGPETATGASLAALSGLATELKFYPEKTPMLKNSPGCCRRSAALEAHEPR